MKPQCTNRLEHCNPEKEDNCLMKGVGMGILPEKQPRRSANSIEDMLKRNKHCVAGENVSDPLVSKCSLCKRLAQLSI